MNETENIKGFHLIVPFGNFDSDSELIKLTDKMCLRRMGKEDLNYPATHRLPLRARALLTKSKFVLDIKGNVENGKGVSYVLLALRLFKAGNVVYPCLSLSGNGELYAIEEAFFDAALTNVVVGHNPYFLERTEIAGLQKLLEKLQAALNKPHLDYSLAHFTRGLEESNLEDKLVYYTTAFESVVFHGETKSIEPAGNAMGIAIGMLLGENERERMDIKKTVIESYEIRNAKVHGNVEKLAKFRNNVQRIVGEAEELLRRTLRKLVEE